MTEISMSEVTEVIHAMGYGLIAEATNCASDVAKHWSSGLASPMPSQMVRLQAIWDVLNELGPVSHDQGRDWFYSRHDGLGTTPLSAIRDGRFTSVREVARQVQLQT